MFYELSEFRACILAVVFLDFSNWMVLYGSDDIFTSFCLVVFLLSLIIDENETPFVFGQYLGLTEVNGWLIDDKCDSEISAIFPTIWSILSNLKSLVSEPWEAIKFKFFVSYLNYFNFMGSELNPSGRFCETILITCRFGDPWSDCP